MRRLTWFSIRMTVGLLCVLGLVMLLVRIATAAVGEVPFGPGASISVAWSVYAADLDGDGD